MDIQRNGAPTPQTSPPRPCLSVGPVNLGLGVHAERYPLSGAARGAHCGADVEVYAFGHDEAPLVSEVKSRKNGAGFALIERWLGEADARYSSGELVRSP